MIKFMYMLSVLFLLSCGTPHAQEHLELLKDVEILSSDAYEGRKTGTKGAEMAREYIKERFSRLGLKTYTGLEKYEQSFSFLQSKARSITGVNLIGYIKGTSDKVIVISAHYDHIGVINGQIHNGADDNASGVAALLYLADHYSKHKPRHTMVFAAFDAEEMGLRGAKAFIASPPIPLHKISLNINMDMISHNDQGELYVCGTFSYPEWKPFIYTSIPDIKILPGHDNPASGKDDWTHQSDHAAFHERKIPFLYFGVEDHKDYHKASDDYQNINKTFFTNATKAILEILDNIDKKKDMQQEFKNNHIMKKQ